MSRKTLLDSNLKRHECVTCDLCGEQWTLEVCKTQGWKLSDRMGNDLCPSCIGRRTEVKKPKKVKL